jgi:hypothetical protein
VDPDLAEVVAKEGLRTLTDRGLEGVARPQVATEGGSRRRGRQARRDGALAAGNGTTDNEVVAGALRVALVGMPGVLNGQAFRSRHPGSGGDGCFGRL